MKKFTLLSIIAFLLALTLNLSKGYAQGVGINADGSLPAANTMLHVKATDRVGIRSNVNFTGAPVSGFSKRNANLINSTNSNFGLISFNNHTSILPPAWKAGIAGVDSSNDIFASGIAGFYKGNTAGLGVYGHSFKNTDFTNGTPSYALGYIGGLFLGGDVGVLAVAGATGTATTKYGIFASASGGSTNYAGYFDGNVHVAGTLSKSGGTFKIDHPQDPANKYLTHSFIESPDMMNVYNGNITTDAQGNAVVKLPGYFEAENIDFKYQLTVIGQFAQAIIGNKVNNNSFVVRTDKPNVEVSWQVTGVRNDKWAQKNRVVPEMLKESRNRGKYLNPDVFGYDKKMGIGYREEGEAVKVLTHKQ